MSRSYKHTPIIRYEKEDYHILNRKIRRNKNTAEIAQYSGYRRFSYIVALGKADGQKNPQFVSIIAIPIGENF